MTSQIPDEMTENARLAGIRSRLLGSVAQVRTPRFSRARKVTVAVIAASGLAIALTGGTIIVVQASQEQISYSVQCYDAASLNATFTTVASPTAFDNATGEELEREALDPVATCGEMWRMGILGQESAPADPNAANFPVPAIVGCALNNGVGAGFPRGDSTATDEDFCRDLGLTRWVS